MPAHPDTRLILHFQATLAKYLKPLTRSVKTEADRDVVKEVMQGAEKHNPRRVESSHVVLRHRGM